MNKDIIQKNWHQLKNKIKDKWNKLTDEELTEIDGKREALLNKLQKHYGLSKEKAEHELSSLEKNLKKSDEHTLPTAGHR